MTETSKNLFKAVSELQRSWSEITPTSYLNKSRYFALGAIKAYMGRNDGSLGATVKDLARESGRSPASISQKISFLEDKGYVKRMVDKNDRRVVYFSLTDDGERVHEQIYREFTDFGNEIIDDLGEEEVLQIIESMNKLKNTVKKVASKME